MTMTVAMTKPVVTQVTCSTVTPRAPVRCGTATFTIEASMAPISVPKVIDTVTSHLLTGFRSVGAVAPPAAASVTAELTDEPRWPLIGLYTRGPSGLALHRDASSTHTGGVL